MGVAGVVLAPAANAQVTNSSTNSSALDSDVAPVTAMNAGSFHTVVIIRDAGVNVVKDWGANGQGQVSGKGV